MLNKVYQPLLSGPSLNIIALSNSENIHTHTHTHTHNSYITLGFLSLSKPGTEHFLFLTFKNYKMISFLHKYYIQLVDLLLN